MNIKIFFKKFQELDFIQGFQDGFHQFGLTITQAVNFVLVFIVYFAGVGLVKIFAALAKKKFMNSYPNRLESSYWVDAEKKSFSKSDFTKMF